MSQAPTISIVICTRNRAAALRQTLASLGRVRVRAEWKPELLVVDNASSDDSAVVVREAKLSNLEVVYFHEPRPGKSNALNAALARTRGDLILFTDDDVDMAADWLEQMVAAFAELGCDAAVGRITLAPHLHRSWMNRRHSWWLACPDEQPAGTPELIGANMGFRRAVLQRVAGYDPELGPGALGLGEEALFGGQLVQAGFKIGYAFRAQVVHAPDASRLKRCDWLDLARKHGRQEAYIDYHWHHVTGSCRWLRWLWVSAKLHLRRVLQPPPKLDEEGCPDWEMCYAADVEKFRQQAIEQRRPRNYARHGLIKLAGERGPAAERTSGLAFDAKKAAVR